MAGNLITFAILAAFVVGVILGIVRSAALARRDETIVRDWAREHGYAILTLGRQGRFFDYVLFILLGPAALIPGLILKLGPYRFRLLIEDEQEGQTHVMVCVHTPGRPVEVHWDYYPPIDPWPFRRAR